MKPALLRIMSRFAHFRVRSKIIIIYLCVGVLPFLLFTVYSYMNANNQMVQSEMAVLQSSLDQAVTAVDGSLERYNAVSNYLFNEPSILTALNKTYGDHYYAMYEAYKNVFEPVYATYYSLYPDLVSMTIYSSCDIWPYNNYVRGLETAERQDWFSQAKGRFNPTWIMTSEGGATKLMCVRRIGVPAAYHYENYLCLEVDYDSVFAPLRNLSSEGYGVLVSGADGETVFSHSAFDDGPRSLQGITGGEEAGTYRVIETALRNGGWTVYYISDPNAIFSAVSRITNATYLTALTILLLLGAVALWFISALVKPIERLTENIRQIDDGRMEITVSTGRTDEIGVLVHSFTDMIARIKSLIEVTYKQEIEKREYQQRLLSAQINPHFLYNSLSLINSRAIMSGQTQISQMTILMSQFYRSALNHGRDITTVDNELTNIRAYVNLQQLISERSFDARFDVDEHLLEVFVPNFILQPIVENAINHGLRGSATLPRLLKLAVRAEGGELIIAVEDNGIGMDERAVVSLLTQQSEGYGVKNVHDRLMLMYNDQCAMTIQSQPDLGTTITLKMPMRFFEDAR